MLLCNFILQSRKNVTKFFSYLILLRSRTLTATLCSNMAEMNFTVRIAMYSYVVKLVLPIRRGKRVNLGISFRIHPLKRMR